jgi:DNA (cytosine-5)-methyltransferase 1
MQTMHLFAGAGGGLLADLILGHTPIVAVEWDAYACQVLRERAAEGWFPELRVWEGDVRLFDPSEYTGIVDCIHAGFPCQDISVAGKQAGVGEETRSGLYREVLRIAGVVRPRYLFLENVAAIVSNGLGTVIADLTALGYDAEWLCLRASDCGAPHQRDRWWCMARNSDCDIQSQIGKIQNLGRVYQETKPNGGGDYFTNANGAQRQGDKRQERNESQYADSGSGGWWSIEPDVGRVANGVASRTHRLKAIGNGQVPLQAAVAWKILTGR